MTDEVVDEEHVPTYPRSILKSTFQSTTVQLDDTYFEACVFNDCVLVYTGGRPPSLIRVSIHNCTWRFDEAAGNTLAFLVALTGDNAGSTRFVLETLLRIPPDTLRRVVDPDMFDSPSKGGADA